MSSGSTFRPPIATIRSPGCIPADCAGFASTASTFGVTSIVPTMKRPAKSATAATTFAAGPALIAAIRLQVDCRQ